MVSIERYKEFLKFLKSIIVNTEFEGKIYTVGGCNRNLFLNKPIEDVDIVVDLIYGDTSFAKYLSDRGYLDKEAVLYKNSKTIKVVINLFEDIPLEITYPKIPNSLGKSDLLTDYFSRDFTVNAIYYNVSKESYQENLPEASLADVKSKILRPVVEDYSTFPYIYRVDPIRYIRFIRLAIEYDFYVTDLYKREIYEALKTYKNKQRLKLELEKLLKVNLNTNDARIVHNLIYIIFEKYHELSYNSKGEELNSYYRSFGVPNTKEIWALIVFIFIRDSMCTNTAFIGKLFKDSILTKAEYSFILNYLDDFHSLIKEYKNDLSQVDDFFINTLIFKSSTYEDFASILKVFSCLNADLYQEAQKNFVNNLNKFNPALLNRNLPINGNDIKKFFNLPNSPIISTLLKEATTLYCNNPSLTKEELLQKIDYKKQ